MTSKSASTSTADAGHAIAAKFLDGLSRLSAPAADALLAPNFTYHIAPSAPFLPENPISREKFLQQTGDLGGLMNGYPVKAREIIVAQGSVIIWADSDASFREEVRDDGLSAEEWTYKAEYMFVLDHDGEKVTRLVEFLDTKKTEGFHALVGRAVANAQRRAGGAA